MTICFTFNSVFVFSSASCAFQTPFNNSYAVVCLSQMMTISYVPHSYNYADQGMRSTTATGIPSSVIHVILIALKRPTRSGEANLCKIHILGRAVPHHREQGAESREPCRVSFSRDDNQQRGLRSLRQPLGVSEHLVSAPCTDRQMQSTAAKPACGMAFKASSVIWKFFFFFRVCVCVFFFLFFFPLPLFFFFPLLENI